MFNITLKHSVTTLAVVSGLLAVAGPASAGTPASAQGGGAVAAAGGYGDRAVFSRLEDRPQHGLINNGTGDDQMVTAVVTDVPWLDSVDWADSNEVAVEGITLAHEGFEIQALGTRSGGEVVSSDAH
jgi:hypothetical protein